MLPKLLLLFLFMPNFSIGVMVPDVTTRNFQKQVEILSEQLEKFNKLYLTTLDQKITSVVTTISALDANFKALQEKAHVWDIFRHHIDAWNDHMKAVDHKIDLIKRTQDDSQSMDGKLSSLEFTMNHILNKVDQINDRSQERIPVVEQKLTELGKYLNAWEQMNSVEKRETTNRLSSILRHVVNIENGNCRSARSPAALAQPIGMNTATILKDMEIKIDALVESLSPEDFKKFIAAEKQESETLEEILDLTRNMDDRTLRIFDSQNDHGTKLENYCLATSNELATFTGSADLLLKRIEKLVLSIQGKVEKVKSSNQQNLTDLSSESVESGETDTYEEEFTKVITSKPPTATIPDSEDSDESQPDFIQPNLTGCHDLDSSSLEGVYTFDDEVDLNSAGRNFNERYCSFPTSGAGWTLIQRRGPYSEQENFNRSWVDYKNGFGTWEKDFWFGLEFMHRLSDSNNSYTLRVELEDFADKEVWAEYKHFRILSEEEFYTLDVSGYSGNATDCLSYHAYVRFSTYDKNNDNTEHPCCPCAPGYGSGWWYDNCSEANLNGFYRDRPEGHDYIGIIWEKWHGDYSLKKVRMLIRPNTDNAYSSEIPEDP